MTPPIRSWVSGLGVSIFRALWSMLRASNRPTIMVKCREPSTSIRVTEWASWFSHRTIRRKRMQMADIARLAGRFAIRDVLLVEADGHTWLSPAMQPRVQWLQRPQQVDVLTGFAEAPT